VIWRRICFDGPEAELTRTQNAQPAIFVASWIGPPGAQGASKPDFAFHATAGLSLGELTALTAAGTFSFEDGLKIARQRGRFMQEACDATKWTPWPRCWAWTRRALRRGVRGGRRGDGEFELPRPDRHIR
jgi:malonyl CoA-acyl carrier protein transacylase